jgi:RNA polymerase sigma factor (sigma-70 family)
VTELIRRVGRPHDVAPVSDAIVETDAFLAALRQLPAQQAAAIVLRHHHGYSSREIATSLGIPESTVASRLAHARQRLSVSMVAFACVYGLSLIL